MNIAVKFYKDVPNPERLPAEWPATCVEIGEATSYEEGWAVMSIEDYHAHREIHRPKYSAWSNRPKTFWQKIKRLFGF